MNITNQFVHQSKRAQLRVGVQNAEGCNWCTGFAPLPTLCSKSFKLCLHWPHNPKLQVEARSTNCQTELIPVHSPLLGQSWLVSHTQPTYMLRFSWLIDLSSCLGAEKTSDPHCRHKDPIYNSAICSNMKLWSAGYKHAALLKPRQ